MNYYNLLFLLFMTLCILIINSALELEELIGGTMAYGPNHRHRVAILGKHNQSQTRLLLGSGSIISDFFILSSAQIFIGRLNRLKLVSFSVVVGSVTLQPNEALIKNILNIYTYGENCYESGYDVAVLELAQSLELHLHSSMLRSLELPSRTEMFEGREGLVAGYGATSVNRITNVEVRSRSRITANSKQNLTFAFVNIAETVLCMVFYVYLDSAQHMCGIIRPNFVYKNRGLCTHDDGASIEVDNKIVGIAYRNRKDCDDTYFGAVYSKVSFYVDFIQAILLRNPLPITAVYPNRPHIDTYRPNLYGS